MIRPDRTGCGPVWTNKLTVFAAGTFNSTLEEGQPLECLPMFQSSKLFLWTNSSQ